MPAGRSGPRSIPTHGTIGEGSGGRNGMPYPNRARHEMRSATALRFMGFLAVVAACSTGEDVAAGRDEAGDSRAGGTGACWDR